MTRMALACTGIPLVFTAHGLAFSGRRGRVRRRGRTRDGATERGVRVRLGMGPVDSERATHLFLFAAARHPQRHRGPGTPQRGVWPDSSVAAFGKRKASDAAIRHSACSAGTCRNSPIRALGSSETAQSAHRSKRFATSWVSASAWSSWDVRRPAAIRGRVRPAEEDSKL